MGFLYHVKPNKTVSLNDIFTYMANLNVNIW